MGAGYYLHSFRVCSACPHENNRGGCNNGGYNYIQAMHLKIT